MDSEIAYSINTMWVLMASFLVFFMQAGFALVEAGFTQAKNAVNILMKNFSDFFIASLAYFAVGYALMFGEGTPLVGMSNFFLSGAVREDIPILAFFLFQLVFAGTAATILSGAMAERTKYGTYLFISLVMTAVIYPIVGHWAWGGGWLADIGFVDFAGSGVVHTVGGIAGLLGTLFLGARKGAFEKGSHVQKGHNVTIAGLGVFILWFGWFGFNPGSQLAAAGIANAQAISLIAVNTNLAAAAGALVATFVAWLRTGKPSVGMLLNGALAGLVGVTAACAAVTPVSAIIIGGIAGIVMMLGTETLVRLKIDDPVGAVPVHGVAGVWGVIAVGLFATDGGLFFGGGTAMLITQIIGAVAIVTWTAVTSGILFWIIQQTVGLRVDGMVEEEGLDAHEHGIEAYAH
ncbi:MAG: ammonium transporter [Candidatus Peribacteraceae bacterium]|nr:ammonium transporter [Candidatus Peribacteraceae bacterium]MBP9851064.1 ammonium transporter [Candidatus Peribacteraceae bacterium]